ncbi:alpha/beta hydrolase [Jiella pacifica]|uniref:Alpha/beta hydrolase fold domain-containing protein n=1 Tax=Jiella pacifica TaxID=2696469 RepID=A0A6N9T2C8_9HYPH|nr:alpha/beta hydrolase [Jiella pacifica]NDW04752.1 alpha/beta hydrolase fold domain-containing protein [Jiella pacifica]
MLARDAKAVLANLARKQAVQTEPRDEAQKLAQARAMTGSLTDYSGAAPAGVASEDAAVKGPAGPIPVRFYRPGGSARAMLIWYHGGGAMAGSLDSHDVALRQLCAATGRLVASVGYRLAPENVSPAPQEDCIAATKALMARAGELGCDPARIAIGGDSIGGLFSAVVALALRDAGAPMPARLVMLYPNTDLRPDRPFASLQTEAGHVMTEASLAYENALFVPEPEDRADPIVSPLLSPDLSGLPPTLLVTCEHDPLRDEGEAFVARLGEAGVAVTSRRFDGMIHGFLQMDGWIDAARDLRRAVAEFLD